MKAILLSLALSATALMANTTTGRAQSADETAIKTVIEADKEAADAADYKAYLSHWAKVPYASFLYEGQPFVGDMLWKVMDNVFASRKPIKATNTRTGWNIRATGETAFMTFSQRVENLDTKSVWETAEARYLEKMKQSDGSGEWKIVSVVVVQKPAK